MKLFNNKKVKIMTINLFDKEQEFKNIVEQAKNFCEENNINYMNQGAKSYNGGWESCFCKSNFINNIFYICINRKGNKILRKENDLKNVEVLEKFPFEFCLNR